MFSPEVRALMWKEWRQMGRNRRAMGSALMLPAGILLFVPMSQILAVWKEPASTGAFVRFPGLPPILESLANDPRTLLRAVLPLMVALGGLLVPALTATHTLIVERESRTLELLAGLPIRIGQILLAKLLVIVMLGGGASLFLVGLDGAVMLATGLASLSFVLALILLLLCALAYSTASALLTSLLAPDFRTANNVNGVLLAPTLLVCLTVLTLAPGNVPGIVILACVFAAGAAITCFIALRVVTFERLLR